MEKILVEPLLLSVKQTTAALSVGNTTVYALIKSGELETIKVGTKRLIKYESIKRVAERGA